MQQQHFHTLSQLATLFQENNTQISRMGDQLDSALSELCTLKFTIYAAVQDMHRKLQLRIPHQEKLNLGVYKHDSSQLQKIKQDIQHTFRSLKQQICREADFQGSELESGAVRERDELYKKVGLALGEVKMTNTNPENTAIATISKYTNSMAKSKPKNSEAKQNIKGKYSQQQNRHTDSITSFLNYSAQQTTKLQASTPFKNTVGKENRLLEQSACKKNKKTIYFDHGLKYEGEVFKNKFDGFGIVTHEDQEIYVGSFKNGFFHGQGRFMNSEWIKLAPPLPNTQDKYRNWALYSGEFKDGKYHGMGTVVLQNEQKYLCKFVQGNIVGEAVYCAQNGRIDLGRWSNKKKFCSKTQGQTQVL